MMLLTGAVERSAVAVEMVSSERCLSASSSSWSFNLSERRGNGTVDDGDLLPIEIPNDSDGNEEQAREDRDNNQCRQINQRFLVEGAMLFAEGEKG